MMRVKIIQVFRHWKICIWLTFGIAVVVLLVLIYWHPAVHAFKFVWSPEYRECVLQSRNYELEEKSTPLYVTLKFHGRLGNWMYGYASLLGIAKANGYIPYLPSSHPLVSYFPLTKIRSSNAECLQVVYDERPCTYNPLFFNLPPGNITIDGYLQSWKYFRFMEEEIRHEFKLHTHLKISARDQLNGYVGKYLKEGHLVISIHVRRGDVLTEGAKKMGFRHAPASYFQSAMSYMLERYPNSVFFVTSDDIEWCKENIKSPRSVHSNQIKTAAPVVFSESTHFWEDFAMLTLCNHSIISVGTFGWWSAWLANGHVVYYKDYSFPGSKLDYETTREDFFPTHWVSLSSGLCSKNINTCTFFLIAVSVFQHMFDL
ncbi:galactoside alpha-(1,2)-fucosyltransferase 2-like [Biomphalaria glabrata]|uniref:L-Fucosyltransferase n=1 Tax=Biomphalaria glabrata TaxID=6526 RepID=A0A9U8EAF6_BIOGL|nr:galactoside alpha-(1,2)-fucosyltransferase 2-like [Biomphalaria glabrata]XP_055886042.1 galactoside alpha-(1,2)-fucosyltransferase 2-like [Biomphalaria glabrata]